jgi:hypothetical protein
MLIHTQKHVFHGDREQCYTYIQPAWGCWAKNRNISKANNTLCTYMLLSAWSHSIHFITYNAHKYTKPRFSRWPWAVLYIQPAWGCWAKKQNISKANHTPCTHILLSAYSYSVHIITYNTHTYWKTRFLRWPWALVYSLREGVEVINEIFRELDMHHTHTCCGLYSHFKYTLWHAKQENTQKPLFSLWQCPNASRKPTVGLEKKRFWKR